MYLSTPVSFTPLPVSRPEDRCLITPLPGGRHQIGLAGKLPPRWLANLAGGLSAHGISILRGCANKKSPTVWEATFEVMPTIGRTLPPHLDCLAMAMNGTVVTAEAQLVLESFIIRPQEGALYVEVLGEDTVGFLMTLLRLFAFYSLHPAEISIDTPGGRVHDRFWLKGLAGLEPTAAVAGILRESLSKYVAS